jgi:hypothetical protein
VGGVVELLACFYAAWRSLLKQGFADSMPMSQVFYYASDVDTIAVALSLSLQTCFSPLRGCILVVIPGVLKESAIVGFGL